MQWIGFFIAAFIDIEFCLLSKEGEVQVRSNLSDCNIEGRKEIARIIRRIECEMYSHLAARNTEVKELKDTMNVLQNKIESMGEELKIREIVINCMKRELADEQIDKNTYWEESHLQVTKDDFVDSFQKKAVGIERELKKKNDLNNNYTSQADRGSSSVSQVKTLSEALKNLQNKVVWLERELKQKDDVIYNTGRELAKQLANEYTPLRSWPGDAQVKEFDFRNILQSKVVGRERKLKRDENDEINLTSASSAYPWISGYTPPINKEPSSGVDEVKKFDFRNILQSLVVGIERELKRDENVLINVSSGLTDEADVNAYTPPNNNEPSSVVAEVKKDDSMNILQSKVLGREIELKPDENDQINLTLASSANPWLSEYTPPINKEPSSVVDEVKKDDFMNIFRKDLDRCKELNRNDDDIFTVLSKLSSGLTDEADVSEYTPPNNNEPSSVVAEVKKDDSMNILQSKVLGREIELKPDENDQINLTSASSIYPWLSEFTPPINKEPSSGVDEVPRNPFVNSDRMKWLMWSTFNLSPEANPTV